ncbi:hypothetical protein HYX13_04180 [Candidatus Woesearchaeota archaeon]|nr:hypothetical protein [Candidatus Woesearchaeota archaeon]
MGETHSVGEKSTLTVAQKILLGILYALVALLIVFSFMALKNKGQTGYDQCIQEKCEKKGQDFCQKPREISNCCVGAGGQVGISGSQYVCVFD